MMTLMHRRNCTHHSSLTYRSLLLLLLLLLPLFLLLPITPIDLLLSFLYFHLSLLVLPRPPKVAANWKLRVPPIRRSWAWIMWAVCSLYLHPAARSPSSSAFWSSCGTYAKSLSTNEWVIRYNLFYCAYIPSTHDIFNIAHVLRYIPLGIILSIVHQRHMNALPCSLLVQWTMYVQENKYIRREIN